MGRKAFWPTISHDISIERRLSGKSALSVGHGLRVRSFAPSRSFKELNQNRSQGPHA